LKQINSRKNKVLVGGILIEIYNMEGRYIIIKFLKSKIGVNQDTKKDTTRVPFF